jgi:hypothetical protein
LIVVAFWVIGAIASAINKRAEAAKRKRKSVQFPEGGAFRTPPPVPQTVAYPTQPARNAGKKFGGKRRRTQAAPPPVAQASPAPSAGLRERYGDAPTDEAPPGRKAKPAVAPAGQIGRLLRRKDSLRAAFILNEVMSPPLAMRDPGEGR